MVVIRSYGVVAWVTQLILIILELVCITSQLNSLNAPSVKYVNKPPYINMMTFGNLLSQL